MIETCTRPVLNRGLCSACYMRLRHNGTIDSVALPSKQPSTSKHIMSDIDLDTKTGTCSLCGPVACFTRNNGKTWRCRTRERERNRAYKGSYSYVYDGDKRLPVAVYREAKELLHEEQGGQCAICGVSPDKLYLDHCHTTGKIRGLLCSSCNTGLGMFKDHTGNLRSAADYLESTAAPHET